jgi:hypothetical protein
LLCAGNHFWALSLTKKYAHARGLKPENTASIPQPLSPFHWANYIVTDDTIYRGLVNLIGVQERTANTEGNIFGQVWSRYQPVNKLSYEPWYRFDDSPWVEKALSLEGVETFLWFARFPVVKYDGSSNGRHRVTFFDLRFAAIDGRKPFLYEVIFDSSGEIVFQGFHRDYPASAKG